MDERDHALGSSPRRPIDQLDTVAGKLLERRCQIVDDVTDVMERRLGVLGDELRDAGLAVGGLDQLDPPLRIAEEHHANVMVRKVPNVFGGEPEGVAEERQDAFDARHRDRDVMERAELHKRGGT